MIPKWQGSGGDASRAQVDSTQKNDADYSWKMHSEKIRDMPGMTVFELTGFPQLPERYTPPPFSAGGHEWQLLIVPQGNANDNAVSVFLGMPPESTDVPRNTRFQLAVVDQNDIRYTVFKESSHTFPSSTNDWGFNKLITQHEIRDKARGFLFNDTLVLCVFIKVTPPLTREVGTYSRRDTGYVGLKNQGATCYMNSLLQSYFHITKFRKLLYSMQTLPPQKVVDAGTEAVNDSRTSPPENRDGSTLPSSDSVGGGKKNLCLALQRVFHNLQKSEVAVDTRDLTTSFGWDSYEAFQQHDVQELNSVLIDKLHEKAKGTELDGRLEQLLEGKVLKYIKCVDVKYESSRKENCLELQLSVKGSPDIMSSFRKFCDEERLDGDNKYNAEGHGLQVALMGTKFVHLPPVLQLHLVRYEYDPMTDSTVKINDRFEFPETLDLNEFMAEKSDVNYTYSLHSVLVHSGDVHGGHYFAFIRPMDDSGSRSQWFRFDDDVVTYALPKEAIEDNFGGEDQSSWRPPFPHGQKPPTIKRFSSAYMLVYVRESEVTELLAPLSAEAIPAELISLFEQENKIEAQTRREKEESHLYTNVHVFTNEHFQAHKGLDVPSTSSPHIELRLKKSETIGSLKSMLCGRLSGVAYSDQTLFSVSPRRNGGLRIDRIIRDDLDVLPPVYGQELMYFVDVSGSFPENHVLLFAKLFDKENQDLLSLGAMRCSLSSTLADIRDKAIQMMPSAYATGPFLMYEERTQHTSELVNDSDLHLNNGDILVLQTTQPPNSQRTTATPVFGTVPEFLAFLSRRVQVTFKHSPEVDEATSLTFADGRTTVPMEISKTESIEPFELVLSGDMKYDDVAAQVAAKVNCPPMRIRFRSQNPYNKQPFGMLHRKSASTLDQMLNISRNRSDASAPVLYFEVLDHDISDLDTNVVITLQLCSLDCKLSPKARFLVPEKLKIDKLLSLVEKRFVTAPPDNTEIGDCKDYYALQLVEMEQHRINRVISSSSTVQDLGQYAAFRVDLIPQSLKPVLQKSIFPKRAKVQMVHVFHFSLIHANYIEAHGIPFHMAVFNDWTAAKFKEEVAKRLALARDDVMSWKVAIISCNKHQYIDDDANVLDNEFAEFRGIGLQHPNTDPSDRRAAEKAVRIKS